ncbi:MAG: glutamate formimidoyltransferase [Bryobacteraceae bacterium]
MIRQIVECVPNFSEGHDPRIQKNIADAVVAGGAALLREEMDPDHNRAVITFAGRPQMVTESAFRAIAAAVASIDLRRHVGVHPRLGAADVVPLVPLEGVTMSECVALAHGLGERVWRDLRVPVFFYEAAARLPERARLENVRRGQFEHSTLVPDIGGPSLDPAAGAVIVGARKLLIAFNINLTTADVSIASQIASKIRASSGGLPCVKAMGVFLESRGLSQVSMNLTDFERTSPKAVFDAVREEAKRLGADIRGSELVGLIPRQALEPAGPEYFRFEDFTPDRILENRLATIE